jgi:hypothetical protein
MKTSNLTHCSTQFTVIIHELWGPTDKNYVRKWKHTSSSSYRSSAVNSGFTQSVTSLHFLNQQSALTSPVTPCMPTANLTVGFFAFIFVVNNKYTKISLP